MRAEIDYLSGHIYELKSKQTTELFKLQEITIKFNISNENLTLTNEKHLLRFIIGISSENPDFSRLFENLYFKNMSNEMIQQIFTTIDIEYLTRGTWLSISKIYIEKDAKIENKKGYKSDMKEKKSVIEIAFSSNNNTII